MAEPPLRHTIELVTPAKHAFSASRRGCVFFGCFFLQPSEPLASAEFLLYFFFRVFVERFGWIERLIWHRLGSTVQGVRAVHRSRESTARLYSARNHTT